MPTTVNKTTDTNLASLARIFYVNYFLKNLRSELVYGNLLSMEDESVIQEEFGPIIQWTFLNDFGEGKTVSENGAVNEEAMSCSTVTASLIMKGNTVNITDRLKSMTMLSKIKAVIDRMSRSASLTVDGMIRRKLTQGGFREQLSGLSLDSYAVLSNLKHSTILSGHAYTALSVTYTHLPYISLSGTGQLPTNIIASIIASNETVPANFTTSSMCITAAKLKYAEKYLANQNVPKFKDGFYRGVIDPWTSLYLERDPELINFISYSGNGLNSKIKYLTGEIGAIGKIRLFESTEASKALYVHTANSSFFSADVANSAWTPSVVTITGSNACTMVDHASKDLGDKGLKALNNVELTMLGFTKEKSDPLGQYMTVAYKLMTAVGILNYKCGVNLLQFYAPKGHA